MGSLLKKHCQLSKSRNTISFMLSRFCGDVEFRLEAVSVEKILRGGNPLLGSLCRVRCGDILGLGLGNVSGASSFSLFWAERVNTM